MCLKHIFQGKADMCFRMGIEDRYTFLVAQILRYNKFHKWGAFKYWALTPNMSVQNFLDKLLQFAAIFPLCKKVTDSYPKLLF